MIFTISPSAMCIAHLRVWDEKGWDKKVLVDRIIIWRDVSGSPYRVSDRFGSLVEVGVWLRVNYNHKAVYGRNYE